MTAMTFKPILVTTLQGLKELVNVFDHGRQADSGFPYATITIASSIEEPFLMGNVNKQSHEFSIKIYDRLDNQAESESKLETIKDLIFAEISDANLRQYGALREEILTSSFNLIDIEGGQAKVLDITFKIEEKVRR